MTKPLFKTTLALCFCGLIGSLEAGRSRDEFTIQLTPIGTYRAQVFDAGASEIVAHDPASQKIYVVNAQAASLDVLNIQDPKNPVKVLTRNLNEFGGVANSVAVRNGLVAVAVENAVKTSPGKVVFFNQDLVFLTSVDVGAMPDMVAFSPNGQFVLTANEGEPNSDYSVDPEGSISIITLKGGMANVGQQNVKTAHFRDFSLANIPEGVRIFGPNASVAQDMEPEYVAISADSRTAWVTCQENNTIAVVDIPSARVTRLIPLGFKDHSITDFKLQNFTISPETLPVIGTTPSGQSIKLGGFSGLHFEGKNPANGRLKFVTHTDRGPNAEPTGINRPFILPGFVPEIVRFELDQETKTFFLTERIPLQISPGLPLTGLPNTAINSSTTEPHNDEVPVDLQGNVLPRDPMGADLEGVVMDSDGTFWMADEYRPALYHFSPNGILLQRFVPVGTAAAAGAAQGVFGIEALPAVLGQRRQNRGFEGIAMDGNKIYAFLQSPIRNPANLSNGALNALKNIRILEFNPSTLATRQFIYILDNEDLGPEPNTRPDKIGDAVSFGNGEFLVIERDDDATPSDSSSLVEKKVYQFNLVGATDVSAFSGTVGVTGKTVDQLTSAELIANGIRPVDKILLLDLAKAGYSKVQKVEGLALINPETIALINDNDFGTASITIHPDGTFTQNQPPEDIQLGIIQLFGNGLDVSDRDNKINIRPWPVKGLFMPDAIALHKYGTETYLITANEGDVREYASFAEAQRVGAAAITLDPVIFPNGGVLKNVANLGRLNVTTTLGKNPATGFYTNLFCFGSRSITIWNSQGQRIWDSGDDLERLSAQVYPAHFNASNTNNDFDNRSDDKGPEPEGLVIGRVKARDYVFVGLERIGGVAVYDITNPVTPQFVDYVNFRDFTQIPSAQNAGDLGPEGLAFVSDRNSPTGKPLLIVGNEISGSTTIYEIDFVKKP